MKDMLLVGVGGFIGSVLRYLLNNAIYQLLDYPIFPIGIFIVNALGCLMIGFLGGLAETRIIFLPEIRLFLFIGLLGGFTTFSSFGYDTFNLFQGGSWLPGISNILLHILIALPAVWIGVILARLL